MQAGLHSLGTSYDIKELNQRRHLQKNIPLIYAESNSGENKGIGSIIQLLADAEVSVQIIKEQRSSGGMSL